MKDIPKIKTAREMIEEYINAISQGDHSEAIIKLKEYYSSKEHEYN